ncbi:MAG: hypothetical protein M3O02_04775 [Acidobacteriota bacterium]|nr:hypothetical protein [Acidobacteriota bacterium]
MLRYTLAECMLVVVKSNSTLPDDLDQRSPQADVKRALVERVVSSTRFKRSDRLCSFLRYVSDCSLSGRADEINEQLIGVHVFGKSPTYNTSEDNIVRTHARLVRQRLDAYFMNEGKDEPFHIHMPRGGYVPVFEIPRAVQEEPSVPTNTSFEPALEVSRPRNAWAFAIFGTAAGLVLGILTTLGVSLLRNKATPPVTLRTHPLWAELFTSERPTLIVVGDAGILMFQNLSKTSVTVDEYAYHTYEKSPYAQTPPGYKWFPLALRTYTSFNEVETVRFLTQLPEAQKAKVRIVFARDLQSDDLRHNNVILLGGPGYDPWEQIFEPKLNYRIVTNTAAGRLDIENMSPVKGESQLYSYAEGDPARRGYAVVSLLDNLSGDGHIFIVQGTTALGDGMATEFLEDGKDLKPILDEAKDGPSTRNFELLLETSFRGTSWSHWKVLGHRVH